MNARAFPAPREHRRSSLSPVLSFVRRQFARVLGGRAASLDSVAARSWEVCPGNTLVTLPALYLPNQLGRVTGSVYGYHWAAHGPTESIEHQMAGGIERWQEPTRAWLLKGACLVDGAIHKGGVSHRLFPRAALLPLERTEVEIDRAAVYASYDGSLFFGLWLQDDCALYPLAAQEGLPLTIGNPQYPDLPDYERRLGMNPLRVSAAYLNEVVIFDDHLQNAGKRARFEGLRRRILARLDPHPHPGVFVLRGPSGKARKLHNEFELAEHLRVRHGFRVVSVADGPAKILAACAGAQILAGVEGSHLAHGFIAMEPGTGALVIQPPDRFSPVLKRAADRDGQRFGFVIGTPEHDGFRVKLEEIDRTLAMFPAAMA